MTTDDEISEEMTGSTSDLESDWRSEEEQENALFGDSQRLIGETLHQAELVEIQRSTATRKHSCYIFVPDVNARVHKTKIIKELVKNKKLSSDRLIRVQQVRQESDLSSCDTSSDYDDECSNVALWDDIAFESEDCYDDRRPYRLAQVLRMRCVTSTRRRIEYVELVNFQRDTEKTIEILVQPYTL